LELFFFLSLLFPDWSCSKRRKIADCAQAQPHSEHSLQFERKQKQAVSSASAVDTFSFSLFPAPASTPFAI